MADYFTSEHFKLLNKWKGTVYDKTNPEQQKVYEELANAFDITKRWAEALQEREFPAGWTKTVRKPTDQWQRKFLPYNWGRIYPEKGSPNELAFTVGIEADAGFVVKIDVVDTQTEDVTLRSRYESIRNSATPSPIVASLSVDEGLQRSLPELVAWSADAIRNFGVRYEDLVQRLNLNRQQSDEDILRRFDGKPAFKTFRASWSAEDSALFCRLARAVHSAGLDWWHKAKNIQVAFGRKNPGSDRATEVVGTVRGTRIRKISIGRELQPEVLLHRVPLTVAIVEKIEAAVADGLLAPTSSAKDGIRPGLWPDQLRDEPAENDDEEADKSETASEGDEFVSKGPINRIYYGPPGTGKTYELARLLKREYEQDIALVSAAEWQKQLIATRIANLTWWEGAAAALFDLNGKAKVAQLEQHPFIQAIAEYKGRTKNVQQTLWGTLQNHTIEASATVNLKHRLSPAVFDKTTDSFWQFAGDWQDACADLIGIAKAYRAGAPSTGAVKRYSFVTFHQSYGYEEFVEGLRPVLDDSGESGELGYEIRSGVFKELCRRARSAPQERFAMVIDEINRGNISKIFGELITLIEADKREGEANAVSVTLPYSGERFAVPANVDIIGTMNTADRSLALLDTALRRRFEFVPVMPDARDEPGAPLAGLRVTMGEKQVNVPRLLEAMNRRIEALYDRDHCIGHAYFTALANAPDGDERLVELQQLFKIRILPLLEEYFFEDWRKIRLVLADNQKEAKAQFLLEGQDHEDELATLFGSEHGLDRYGAKRRCVLQDAAFANPDAYIGIYETLAD